MYGNASKIAVNATCGNNFNKIGLPHVYIALFRCLWVPGGGLEPFMRVLRSDGWLPLKKNTRQATHWPNDPHSKLRKFHKNGPISPKLPHDSRR